MKHGNIMAVVFCSVVVLIGSGPAEAANSYKVNAGASTDIDEFSVCKKVTNGGAKAILVPTKSSAEWSAFRSKLPTGVTLGACPVACGGELVNGYCWRRATAGMSCTDYCASRGGCSEAGVDWGATAATCRDQILAALGLPTTNPTIVAVAASHGCGYTTNTYVGTNNPTCAAVPPAGTVTRICPCGN